MLQRHPWPQTQILSRRPGALSVLTATPRIAPARTHRLTVAFAGRDICRGISGLVWAWTGAWLMVDTNEKPFRCPHCESAFGRYGPWGREAADSDVDLISCRDMNGTKRPNKTCATERELTVGLSMARRTLRRYTPRRTRIDPTPPRPGQERRLSPFNPPRHSKISQINIRIPRIPRP